MVNAASINKLNNDLINESIDKRTEKRQVNVFTVLTDWCRYQLDKIVPVVRRKYTRWQSHTIIMDTNDAVSCQTCGKRQEIMKRCTRCHGVLYW